MDVETKDFNDCNSNFFDYIDESLKRLKAHTLFSGGLTDMNIDVIKHAINSFKTRGGL